MADAVTLTSATEEVASNGARDTERSGDDAESCLRPVQSFSPDTGVVLANGETVPIDRVKVGEKVKAVDTKTGKSVVRDVTAVWVNHDTDLMDVTITGGNGARSTIHATQHHPFWDRTTHTWVDADHLRGGDQLLADDGTSVTFDAAVIVPGAADMWDLTISGVHDFYVANSTTSVLVHNIDCSTVSGKFPNPSDPGATLARRDGDGDITNYQTYDSDGLPLKRVDLTGRAHGGIPTPHVQEFARNINPQTGETFINKLPGVREATPEEIP